jgi:hypothetical protein
VHDDREQIADDDQLYRLVHPKHRYPDGGVMGLAFRRNGTPDPEISVNVVRLTIDVRLMLARKAGQGHCIGVLNTGRVRGMNLGVVHEPIPANNELGLPRNYAHALITGARTKPQCEELAQIVTMTSDCA